MLQKANPLYYLVRKRATVIVRGKEVLIEDLTRGERIRLAIEELGPTFVKMGQIFSTRTDLIPLDIILELKKLQDDVPPYDFKFVIEQVETEFGCKWPEKFKHIAPEPIAAASIAQVHKAELHDGTIVVIKVQRPGILRPVMTDLEILQDLSDLVHRKVLDVRQYNLPGLSRELKKLLLKELDFTREAHHIERFRINTVQAKLDDNVVIPQVYWDQTGNKVLTMEFIDGFKVNDFERIDALGLDRADIAHRGAQLVLQQIFVDGFFHGDPHPGNIFVLPDGRIALLDFGNVGQIDSSEQEDLCDFLIAIVQKDIDNISRILLSFGVVSEDLNLKEFKTDVGDFIGSYYGIPLYQLDMAVLLEELMDLVVRHKICFLPEYSSLIKVLITIEGIARDLDPHFDLIGEATPFVQTLIKRKYSPEVLLKKSKDMAFNYFDWVAEFPKASLTLAKMLQNGTFSVNIRHEELGNALVELDKISNRIAFAIVVASVIIGTSLLLMSLDDPYKIYAGMVGALGFSVAWFLGLWLLFAIIRSGKL